MRRTGAAVHILGAYHILSARAQPRISGRTDLGRPALRVTGHGRTACTGFTLLTPGPKHRNSMVNDWRVVRARCFLRRPDVLGLDFGRMAKSSAGNNVSAVARGSAHDRRQSHPAQGQMRRSADPISARPGHGWEVPASHSNTHNSVRTTPPQYVRPLPAKTTTGEGTVTPAQEGYARGRAAWSRHSKADRGFGNSWQQEQ
jgi:hypothetical protein